MTIKMLTDKRGPLQGVSVDAIVRNAYGPDARYEEGGTDEGTGVIVASGNTLDTVIDLHETDG